jgi:hypothetical protein
MFAHYHSVTEPTQLRRYFDVDWPHRLQPGTERALRAIGFMCVPVLCVNVASKLPWLAAVSRTHPMSHSRLVNNRLNHE